jgi:hypothetical protein
LGVRFREENLPRYDPDREAVNVRFDRGISGLYFAQWSLFLTVASMIAVFDFSLPIGEDGQPIHPALDFTNSTVVR